MGCAFGCVRPLKEALYVDAGVPSSVGKLRVWPDGLIGCGGRTKGSSGKEERIVVVSGAACGIGRHAFLPGVFAAKAFPFVSTQPGIGGEGDCRRRARCEANGLLISKPPRRTLPW